MEFARNDIAVKQNIIRRPYQPPGMCIYTSEFSPVSRLRLRITSAEGSAIFAPVYCYVQAVHLRIGNEIIVVIGGSIVPSLLPLYGREGWVEEEQATATLFQSHNGRQHRVNTIIIAWPATVEMVYLIISSYSHPNKVYPNTIIKNNMHFRYRTMDGY